MNTNKLIVKLLIHCLRLLMDIKSEQTGSNYSFEKESETIREARKYIGDSIQWKTILLRHLKGGDKMKYEVIKALAFLKSCVLCGEKLSESEEQEINELIIRYKNT